MTPISIGGSDLSASRMAYGCWRIAGAIESPELTSDRLVNGRRAILAAYDAGYTLFDHADIYAEGVAEQLFGKVLGEVSTMRRNILIASKCGIRRHGDPTERAPYRYDSSAEHIIRSCEGSLARLGVETIDLYQIHRPDFLGDPEEIAAAFVRLKDAGKVRHFGLSNAKPHTVSWLQRFCPVKLIANQIEISLMKLDSLHDGTLEQCQMENMTPLAWSPLAAGRITYNGAIALHEHDHARRLKLRETLDLVARERGVSRSVTALAWLLRHPSKIVPIIGSTNPTNIEDAAKAVDLELSREDWYLVFEAALGHRLA